MYLYEEACFRVKPRGVCYSRISSAIYKVKDRPTLADR
nr:MAG TPA: hypothetical protein [Caudoviricetes sp.]